MGGLWEVVGGCGDLCEVVGDCERLWEVVGGCEKGVRRCGRVLGSCREVVGSRVYAPVLDEPRGPQIRPVFSGTCSSLVSRMLVSDSSTCTFAPCVCA